MNRHRLTAFALPLLLVAGCATPPPPTDRADMPAGQRFAGRLETAEVNASEAVRRVADFEQVVAREEAAVTYALGTRRPAATSTTSAAEAAALVLAPAFTAIGDYGHVLDHAATGRPLSTRPGQPGADLAKAAEAGLAAVQASAGVTVAPDVRTAGLAGIAALSDIAETLAMRGSEPGLQALTQDAAPHLNAVVELLRQVLGTSQGQAVRGAVRANRGQLNAAHDRLLVAARSSNRDPVVRYGLYRSIAALRDNDPVQGSIGAVVTVLETMRDAHSALAADPSSADAANKVAVFDQAVQALGEIAGVQQQAAE